MCMSQEVVGRGRGKDMYVGRCVCARAFAEARNCNIHRAVVLHVRRNINRIIRRNHSRQVKR